MSVEKEDDASAGAISIKSQQLLKHINKNYPCLFMDFDNDSHQQPPPSSYIDEHVDEWLYYDG